LIINRKKNYRGENGKIAIDPNYNEGQVLYFTCQNKSLNASSANFYFKIAIK
jgi:hypothetical protein